MGAKGVAARCGVQLVASGTGLDAHKSASAGLLNDHVSSYAPLMQEHRSQLRLAALRELLCASVAPEHLWIVDESAAHVGHAGARSGAGHYYVRVVASPFKGRSRVERHRLIYQAVGGLFGSEIHALRVDALAPEEWCGTLPGPCDCCVCSGVPGDATPVR